MLPRSASRVHDVPADPSAGISSDGLRVSRTFRHPDMRLTVSMAAKRGRPLRAGVPRVKRSIMMPPDYDDTFERMAKELGLHYGDLIVYLASKGAEQEVPPYIQDDLKAARNASLADPLIDDSAAA